MTHALLIVLSYLVAGAPYASPSAKAPDTLRQAQAINRFGKLPLSFEPNLGQTDPRVKFLTRGHGYALFLTPTEAVLHLFHNRPSAVADAQSRVMKMRFVGGNPAPRMKGESRLPGRVNYFIGSDSRKWKQDIAHYARVRQDEVYPGIDLIYYGNKRHVEYDFLVAPGANANVIKLLFVGADRSELSSEGDLMLRAGAGRVRLRKPVVYQIVDGRKRSIACRYTLLASKVTGSGSASATVGFEIGDYDLTRSLVIDPVLSYSTYLGGAGSENGAGIAVDAAGNAYVTGWTLSTNFPTVNPIQQSYGGGTIANDAFITKLNPAGNAVIYSTYLGGTGEDRGRSIAVDGFGSVYLTGETASTNFPITAGSFRTTHNGLADVFVAKLNPAGSSIVYSTYLGSTGDETGFGIVVYPSGRASITGRTNSASFPTTPQAFRTTQSGGFDAFVSTLNDTGSTLVYSTYLGGNSGDEGHAIASDSAGNAYICGTTFSSNFPTTAGAFQTTPSGFSRAFVTKLNSLGTALLYSTYLGGGFVDEGYGIATDASGSAYVTGRTLLSQNFPTRNAFQQVNGGFDDAFVAKFNATGTALEYSSFLGGQSQDAGLSIATDASGNAYVTGRTNSANFPTTSGAIQTLLGGENDVFVSKVSATGSTLAYSTFLGGSFNDEGYGIAVDFSGNVYVTGLTRSTNFPIADPFQATHRGGSDDAFIAKIDMGTDVQLTLLFPRLVTTDGGSAGPDASEVTGIAVANLGTTNGRLSFTAFDKTGALISGSGITNPKIMDLKAGEQIPIIDSQVFGSGLVARKLVGWFKVDSTVSRLAGFFLTFNSSLSFLDGADVSSGKLTSFIFPEIEDQGFTQIHIANPNPDAAVLTLELRNSNGVLRATAPTRTVNPNAALVEFVTDLFPGIAPAGSDQIRVLSSKGVVPFEFLGKSGLYAEGLNGQDTTTGATVLYSPQYVVGGPDWRSTLSVVNLDSTPGNVTFEFVRDDGTLIGTRQASIDARGKIYVSDQEFFVSAGSVLTQGYVKITSSGPRLAGSVVFGDPGRTKFSSALPLVFRLQPTVVFSQVASNLTYFTGIALLNPNDSDASTLIEVFDKEGALVVSKSEVIPAKRRKSQLLTEYFPTLDGRELSSGYIRVTASQNVASFALFGTHGLSVLSAIPPQLIQ